GNPCGETCCIFLAGAPRAVGLEVVSFCQVLAKSRSGSPELWTLAKITIDPNARASASIEVNLTAVGCASRLQPAGGSKVAMSSVSPRACDHAATTATTTSSSKRHLV